jgi:mono/diheme cytochrome c family protein
MIRMKDTLAGLALLAGLAAGSAALAAASGQQVYADNCSVCHQPTGLGRPPVFPALKGDKLVAGPKAPLIATVLNGRGGMPAWKDQLGDADIAAALTYVRSAWGAAAPPVSAAEVAAVRAGKTLAAGKPLQAH